VNTAWALGLIVGPALGGYLSQVPVQKENKRKEKYLIFLLQYPFFHSQLKNILTYFPKILSLAGKSFKHSTYCLLRNYKLLGINGAHCRLS